MAILQQLNTKAIVEAKIEWQVHIQVIRKQQNAEYIIV
jgi:hypothetical protein